MGFKEAYKQLNNAQKTAVDTIEGPLLVVAGPGTGKTQLLAARVANILLKTDTPPQNILCLTFTESAAQNMRERLISFIGSDAYDVKIGTYHSFGSDIIRSYPEYFESVATEYNEESRLERPIDELTKHQIVLGIAESLPYDNPLKSTRYHVGDVIHTVSDLKKALLGPAQLKKIAQVNLHIIQQVSPKINSILSGVATMPSKFATSIPLFERIQDVLIIEAKDENTPIGLATQAHNALLEAIESATTMQKSTPLTAWKNAWLHKTAQNTWSFTDPKQTHKLVALADILEQYSRALAKNNLYDFDDMILRAIEALQQNDELRFNLQEKYLYILLDEFQDTNVAQFELVKQLTNNPASEGSPNVMAVGDDDQAIFAFQGAEASNMINFTKTYTKVPIINLTQNYRSHPHILTTAHGIAEQIHTRLHSHIKGVQKKLTAEYTDGHVAIERQSFADMPNEYTWVANKINELIKDGADAQSIAVLAPRHKYLEHLVPFLNAVNIPVSYEKRENILEAPVILHLKTIAQFIVALQNNNEELAAYYGAIVLSHPAWNVPIDALWQVNWAAKDYKESSKTPWLQAALSNKATLYWITFFMTLAGTAATTSLENILDYCTGTQPLTIGKDEYTSPLKEYYFGDTNRTYNQYLFFETLTQLSVIRSKLREYQQSVEHTLMLNDFVLFFTMYDQAEQPLASTHPITQSENAVTLMTAFKAKGLEYDHVFLLSVHNDIWGPGTKNNNNKLSLPPNLKYIRYQGADEDEQLRLLFVAITRAKSGLYFSSHTQSDGGKKILPLKFLQETPSDDSIISTILPQPYQNVQHYQALAVKDYQTALTLLWHAPHSTITPQLKDLLKERLSRYVMSPTHINTFIDLQYGGPTAFLLTTLLRFPKAPTTDGQFGNAIHEALDWYCKQSTVPTIKSVQSIFKRRLEYYFKGSSEQNNLIQRGTSALQEFLEQKGSTISHNDISEYDFRNEGVIIGDVHLSGKIDRMIINKKDKTIIVVDYKTGESFTIWKNTIKLLKYKQQLYLYKLLVEGSHTFKGYTVTKGILEFVETDDDGICQTLELDFNDQDEHVIKQLITVIWQKIHALDLPEVNSYPQTYKGVLQFIDDLITLH